MARRIPAGEGLIGDRRAGHLVSPLPPWPQEDFFLSSPTPFLAFYYEIEVRIFTYSPLKNLKIIWWPNISQNLTPRKKK